MAAYGLQIKQMLDDKLHGIDGFMQSQSIRRSPGTISASLPRARYREEISQLSLEEDEIVQSPMPEDEFWEAIEIPKERISGYDFQRTDIIYIGFKSSLKSASTNRSGMTRGGTHRMWQTRPLPTPSAR